MEKGYIPRRGEGAGIGVGILVGMLSGTYFSQEIVRKIVDLYNLNLGQELLGSMVIYLPVLSSHIASGACLGYTLGTGLINKRDKDITSKLD